MLAHWRKVLDKPEPWVLNYRQMLHNAVVGFILREDNLQLLATKDIEALQAMMPHDPRLTSAAETQLVRRPDGQLLVDRPLSSSRGALRASQQRIKPDEVEDDEEEEEEEKEEKEKEEAKEEREESEAEAENKEEQQHEVVEPLQTTDTQEEVVEAKAEATEAEPRARSQCETEDIARWEAEIADEAKVAQATSTTADDATELDAERKEEEETTTTEQERDTLPSGSEASASALPSVKESNQEKSEVASVVVEEKPEEPTTYTFHTDLQRLVKCSQFADVTFAVEGELIPAHKVHTRTGTAIRNGAPTPTHVLFRRFSAAGASTSAPCSLRA